MIPTIIIGTIVGIVFFAIIIKGIINRKKGKSSCSCGGGCKGCAMNRTCHVNINTEDKK